MGIGKSERLVMSVALGYAIIFNVIGSSKLNLYPEMLLILAAFGVGIAMVFGTLYIFITEPGYLRNLKLHLYTFQATRKASHPC